MFLFSLMFIMFFALFCYGAVCFYFSGFAKEPKSAKNRVVKLVISFSLGILCNFFRIFALAAAHLTVFLGISVLIFKICKKPIDRITSKKISIVIKNIYKTGIVPIVSVFVLFIYGYYNMNNVVATTYNIQSDKLNNNYKIIFISDIHYASVQSKDVLSQKVDQINKQNPDIVILGGDIVDESANPSELSACFETLAKIQAEHGKFFVYGNHDRQRYSANPSYTEQQLTSAIQNAGFKILNEEAVTISDDLVIFGREDVGSRSEKQNANSAYFDKDKFLLTVDHQPRDAKNNATLGSDLIISGHTHAGQIFPIGLLTFFNSGYSYGMYDVGTSKLIVSSGFAGWGFPIRTSKHSEYVVVNLTAK